MRVSGLIAVFAMLWPMAARAQDTDSGGAPATPGTAVIRGHVTAAADGRPVARAEVDLFSASGGLSQHLVADENGWFEFTGLEAGRWVVRATATGFLPGSTGSGGLGARVDLKDGEVRSDLDVALSKGGVIAVRVTDDAGAAVEGALVEVQRVVASTGEMRLQTASSSKQRTITTDDRGEIRFYDLEPGDYYVSATPAVASKDANARRRTARIATYYPGVARLADAAPVTLALGEEIAVDILLQPAPGQESRDADTAPVHGGVIVVHVTDETGNPRAGVEVRPLLAIGVGESRMLAPAVGLAESSRRSLDQKVFYTDDRGDVRIYGLPASEYAVVAQPALSALADREHSERELRYPPIYYPGSASPADAHALLISPWDEVRLELALAPARAAHVRGRVERWDGEQGRASVVLRWSPTAALYPVGVSDVLFETELVDGEFWFNNVLPGDYVIQTSYEKDSNERDGDGEISVTVAGEDIADLVLKTTRAVSAR